MVKTLNIFVETGERMCIDTGVVSGKRMCIVYWCSYWLNDVHRILLQ